MWNGPFQCSFVVHLLSCDPMDDSTPGSPFCIISQHLLEFMSIELVLLSNHLSFLAVYLVRGVSGNVLEK